MKKKIKSGDVLVAIRNGIDVTAGNEYVALNDVDSQTEYDAILIADNSGDAYFHMACLFKMKDDSTKQPGIFSRLMSWLKIA